MKPLSLNRGLGTHKAAHLDWIGMRVIRLERREIPKKTMERSTANIDQTLDPSDRLRFYVVIIYQDISAGRRAKQFYDRVIQGLADPCNFSWELWSFQVLALPEIGNLAAQAAAQADFWRRGNRHGTDRLKPTPK